MLRCQLEEIESSPEIDRLSYRDLIRAGAKIGFIDDPNAWFIYRESRNITSYTYEQEKAEQVFDNLKGFLIKVEFLLNSLKRY